MSLSNDERELVVSDDREGIDHPVCVDCGGSNIEVSTCIDCFHADFDVEEGSLAPAAKSQARALADQLTQLNNLDIKDGFGLIALPVANSVSHYFYHVGYFDDKSILIWARGEGFLVLDEDRTYCRDTIEHLARCLGMFTQEERAHHLQKYSGSAWVDGIHWAKDGSFIEF